MGAKETLNSSSKLTTRFFLQSTKNRIENSIQHHTGEATAYEPDHGQPAPPAPSPDPGVISYLYGQSSCLASFLVHLACFLP